MLNKKLLDKMIRRIEKLSGTKEIHFLCKGKGHKIVDLPANLNLSHARMNYEIVCDNLRQINAFGGLVVMVSKKRFQLMAGETVNDILSEVVCFTLKKNEIKICTQSEEDFVIHTLYQDYIKMGA